MPLPELLLRLLSATTLGRRTTLLRVPRAAHFTYAERPELVWPAVERFLSGDGVTAER
jgi:pimeloyl-ACP methyl ester carboxylesterase